jgi:hypothetical protein
LAEYSLSLTLTENSTLTWTYISDLT